MVGKELNLSVTSFKFSGYVLSYGVSVAQGRVKR